MSRSGADLTLLLLGGFRVLADRATAELASRGYDDVRPVHGFALRAVLAGADTASELGRRLSVTKQAAAKTVAVLEARGYLARAVDPADGRRMRLQLTPLGHELLSTADTVFDGLRASWEEELGQDRLFAVEDVLRQVVGSELIRPDSPGGADYHG